jgi:hypothetical protein
VQDAALNDSQPAVKQWHLLKALEVAVTTAPHLYDSNLTPKDPILFNREGDMKGDLRLSKLCNLHCDSSSSKSLGYNLLHTRNRTPSEQLGLGLVQRVEWR